LVKYLVYRMAYDESTAWFRVQHCLKPLRPFAKKKVFSQKAQINLGYNGQFLV